MRSVHSRSGTAASVCLGRRTGDRGAATGVPVGHVAGGDAADEVVEHLLREGAAAHLHEALDREAPDGLEDVGRLPALGEHVGEDRVARRVGEPVGDRGVAGERLRVVPMMCFLSTGQQCPVLGYTRADHRIPPCRTVAPPPQPETAAP